MHGIKHIKPLGLLPRIADTLMVPIMQIATGNLHESPQRTHRWNNRKLTKEEVEGLDPCLMVEAPGIQTGAISDYGFRFHIPILGGWRDYIVIRPIFEDDEPWYPGWTNEKVSGVSRLPINGAVRLLLGPTTTRFFGVLAPDGYDDFDWFSTTPPPRHPQIKIEVVNKGRIGVRSKFSKLPLL